MFFFAGSSYAQTSNIAPEWQAAVTRSLDNTQVTEPDAIQNVTNGYEVTSVNSTKSSSLEPTPFIDAYELGFIEDKAGAEKQDLTQDELAKIKKSFDVSKSTDDPRYKPVFNIRVGEEKPEWQRGDYYPAGR